jgi:hypothetical protein
MKALVFDGKIVQIEGTEFPISKSLQWVDLTDIAPTPQVGWFYDGVVFTSPPPPPPPPPPPTNDEIYDQVIKNQSVFKGYVLAINDGSIFPGGNMTNAQIKSALKAKM